MENLTSKDQRMIEIEVKLKEFNEKLQKCIFSLIEIRDSFNEIERFIFPDPLMPFGKYSGKPISSLPMDYINWLYASGSLDKYDNRELKKSIENFINSKKDIGE